MRVAKDTLEQLQNRIDRLHKACLEMGVKLEDLRRVTSRGAYGNSVYLYVDGLKVRASDHGVLNTQRAISEYHLREDNFEETVIELEVRLFRNRFKEVINYEYNDPCERTEKALDSLNFDYEVLDERMSKRGNNLYIVRIKNKEIISYNRL